jgi:hypothetical protein
MLDYNALAGLAFFSARHRSAASFGVTPLKLFWIQLEPSQELRSLAR